MSVLYIATYRLKSMSNHIVKHHADLELFLHCRYCAVTCNVLLVPIGRMLIIKSACTMQTNFFFSKGHVRTGFRGPVRDLVYTMYNVVNIHCNLSSEARNYVLTKCISPGAITFTICCICFNSAHVYMMTHGPCRSFSCQ